jgi:acetolactate synthase-1/2/3 large subunit
MYYQEATSDELSIPAARNRRRYNFQAFKIKEKQKFITNHGLGPMDLNCPAVSEHVWPQQKTDHMCRRRWRFRLIIQELETLHRLNLPVKIFIIEQTVFHPNPCRNTHFGDIMLHDPSSG